MRVRDHPAQLSIPLSFDQHDTRTTDHRLQIVQNRDAIPGAFKILAQQLIKGMG
jgi:hypothetical protein